MADEPTPTPPYDVALPARFADTPFDELPAALQRRVLEGRSRASTPPAPEG